MTYFEKEGFLFFFLGAKVLCFVVQESPAIRSYRQASQTF